MAPTMAATQKTNVEIAEELYEAFNQGDIETCLAGFVDDITWTEPEESPMIGGTHHGPEAVLENVFTPIDKTFDSFQVDVDQFIDGGDTIVMQGTHRVTTTDGDVMEIPAVHVSGMEDGKVTRFTGYEDTALAQQLMDE